METRKGIFKNKRKARKMTEENKTVTEDIEGRIRLALYETVALLDKYVVKRDLDSLWRLKLAINNAMRDLGLNQEYYDEAFFPILVCGQEPRLLRPDKVVDQRKKIEEILKALAKKGNSEDEK